MGETTLLEYALRSAADMRTVQLVGVQSDSGFGFGALHRLFIPFMDRIGSLPDRQRDAIGTAFGCRGRPAAGSVLVGLATLTVFSEVAAERALLCPGNDVQWIDRESFDVLGLVARRLLLEGLPGLDIAGLDEHPGVGRR